MQQFGWFLARCSWGGNKWPLPVSWRQCGVWVLNAAFQIGSNLPSTSSMQGLACGFFFCKILFLVLIVNIKCSIHMCLPHQIWPFTSESLNLISGLLITWEQICCTTPVCHNTMTTLIMNRCPFWLQNSWSIKMDSKVTSTQRVGPRFYPAEHWLKHCTFLLPIVHSGAISSPGKQCTRPATWFKTWFIWPGHHPLLHGSVLVLMCLMCARVSMATLTDLRLRTTNFNALLWHISVRTSLNHLDNLSYSSSFVSNYTAAFGHCIALATHDPVWFFFVHFW